MLCIRNNTFETNSSSCHCLAIAPKDLREDNLEDYVLVCDEVDEHKSTFGEIGNAEGIFKRFQKEVAEYDDNSPKVEFLKKNFSVDFLKKLISCKDLKELSDRSNDVFGKFYDDFNFSVGVFSVLEDITNKFFYLMNKEYSDVGITGIADKELMSGDKIKVLVSEISC